MQQVERSEREPLLSNERSAAQNTSYETDSRLTNSTSSLNQNRVILHSNDPMADGRPISSDMSAYQIRNNTLFGDNESEEHKKASNSLADVEFRVWTWKFIYNGKLKLLSA